ncbi:MAG TPA: ABC transporter substrate-binding protein [Candidatus Competibacteraceae bacterium]|nr:ABC transporter substrate-binding protein [Candidatus Competibacteraceae bacterium]
MTRRELLRWLGAATLAPLAGCTPPPRVERGDAPLPEDAERFGGAPGRYGGRCVLSLIQEPKGLHPLTVEDAYTSQVVGLLQSGLTRYDPIADEPVPALAKGWEVSDDHLSYTFHLRRGLRWSDGAPLTADDVLFTFDALFDARYPNRYAQQYTIAGERLRYEKIDEHTLRIGTAQVYAPLVNDIGFVSILPRHRLQPAFAAGTLLEQWTTQTALREPQAIVGSGPYRLLSYRPGERLVLTPNPHYWRGDRQGQRLPYIDFLIIRIVASQNTETVLFATGQSDAAEIGVGDVAWVGKAAATYDFTLHDRGPAAGIGFIWFNQNPGRDARGRPFVAPHKLAWFRERRFRQALLHALDRPGLVQAVYFGRGQPLHSVISPANGKWYNPDLPRYDYDPERARALLAAAGFRWRDDGLLMDAAGNPVEFELLGYEGSQRLTAILTTFQENLRALGIRLRLSYVDFGSLVERTSRTFDYEASVMGLTGGGDPSGGKAIYRSDGRLHVWYPNQPRPATEWEARIDALMDAQERTLNEAERIRLIHEMQRVFAEELPLLFLVTPNAYVGVRNRWRNVRVPPSGPVTWNIDEWWTAQEKG